MADVTEDGPGSSELLRNVEELGRRGNENEADGRLCGAAQEVQLKYGQTGDSHFMFDVEFQTSAPLWIY